MIEIKQIKVPANLNEHTAKLVCRFAEALAEKLREAELKYEYSDGWLAKNWEAECRHSLHEHMTKGDPRDVAAFCAFMWHHGWSTKEQGASGGCAWPECNLDQSKHSFCDPRCM